MATVKAKKAVKAVKATKVVREKPVKKTVAKPTAKVTKVEAKVAPKTEVVASEKGITASVFGMDGKAAGHVTLPKEFFGAKINNQLIAQSVRVYLANQRAGTASTKTRGEVEGSTRKIYRQKGTGRARHGAIRAPIFVGGGVVFGPKPRDYSLDLPQKMKKAALASALTEQLNKGNIILLSGLATIEPKTKLVAAGLDAVGAMKRTLLVISDKAVNVQRAARNIERVDIIPVHDLSPYAVISHPKVVFMKEAISQL